MPNDNHYDPVAFKGVMVSSTFTDLVEHRQALMKAINRYDLKPIGMEDDSAKVINVLDSSLGMVRKAAAYIGVISHKYGQIPEDRKLNPDGLSLTELEFAEAERLGRPVLLFIMGPTHPVIAADVESDPEKRRKLAAFTERAKRMNSIDRVYKVFDSLQQFEVEVMKAVSDLRDHLDGTGTPSTQPAGASENNLLPTPPALYAEPPYIGSHEFVGREAQLQTLSDWAAAADPHPVLLFEAIGGAGKSMLTWEWTTKHATAARADWAGRFWYSFYEKGSVMADFCQRTLAYMTGRPLEDLRNKKTLELSELLLQQLRKRPWLLILDGLERVLVAYNRIDAAQLADEEAGNSDAIAHRDPCAAIRPEDDDLLRTLASAAPSKLLITSRLIPRVLLNPASQPIPGVRHERLSGLRPPDAEALLRSCGVIGSSADMQSFLQSHCDCHPLVTGILAGLINDYLPDRGNFDRWAGERDGGAALNLADLDLVQKRNHILRAALDALPEKSRQLLSTLALLSEAVDSDTLRALNPHLSAEPNQVEEPENELAKTVRDLERRGLLQYDPQAKRYDLHPVVRGVAAGGLRQEERESYGKKVVDYFSRKSHNPYEEAETLEDVSAGLHLVRTLIQMGRYEQAVAAYRGGLANALWFNLEAHATTLSLLRPFFIQGWAYLPDCVDIDDGGYLANDAAIALAALNEPGEALASYGAGLYANLQAREWKNAGTTNFNVSMTLLSQNRIAAAGRCRLLGLDIATFTDDGYVFRARLDYFSWLSHVGRKLDAEPVWNLLDPMGREWPRPLYRPGLAEYDLARFRFRHGELHETELVHAETLAKQGRDRSLIRDLHRLRGNWHMEQDQWSLAASSLHEAVRMAREVGRNDSVAEAQLALANFHLGRLAEPRHEAQRLSLERNLSHIDLAALWLAIGDPEQTKKHALAAYEWAWADGEPYVRRYELDKARGLLEELSVEVPTLPPYDPEKDEKLPWEQEVADAVATALAERKAAARKKGRKRK
jgi:Domain of unknown function (DUF4062)